MPPAGLSEIGPSGILTLIVLAVCFGFLIPRWTFNRVVRQLEQDKREWRSIALKLMGVGEVAVKALEEIKEEAAKK
jgi:hypothetical protein